MNTYITLEQLAAIFGQESVDNVASETNGGAQAILDATNAEIDLYVRSQIGGNTLADTGLIMLRQAAADLAIYRLSSGMVKEDMRVRAEDALKLLAKVSKPLPKGGFEVTLPVLLAVDDPDTPEDESNIGAAAGSAPRLYSRRALRGYIGACGSSSESDW
jgi:phage gp36-like protein